MDPTYLQVFKHCPLCQANYGAGAVEIITGLGKGQMLYAYCASCHRGILSMAYQSKGWVSSVGMMTDLSLEEARELSEKEPLSAEESAAIRLAIREKSREFCALLRRGHHIS